MERHKPYKKKGTNEWTLQLKLTCSVSRQDNAAATKAYYRQKQRQMKATSPWF